MVIWISEVMDMIYILELILRLSDHTELGEIRKYAIHLCALVCDGCLKNLSESPR